MIRKILVFGLLGLSGMLVSCGTPYTALIRDSHNEVVSNSIASLEEISLGGVKQWICIRGQSEQLPVLLYLHGGPGSAEIAMMSKYNTELEKHCIVVYWDQRGCGKSWKAIEPRSNMTVAQFISDTHELTGYLQKRFGQKKIFLMGHSWGSLLGTLTVKQYPLDYYAYIGVGQAVDMVRNEKAIYHLVLSNAILSNNKEAVAEISKYGEPSYFTNDLGLSRDDFMNRIWSYRKYLAETRGEVYNNPKGSQEMFMNCLMGGTEYAMDDKMHYMDSILDTLYLMWGQVMKINLFRDAPKLAVPVFLLMGRHDYTTPAFIAEEYFKALSAPRKEWIWFEKSAHSPNYEESEAFQKALIEKVLPLAK